MTELKEAGLDATVKGSPELVNVMLSPGSGSVACTSNEMFVPAITQVSCIGSIIGGELSHPGITVICISLMT